MTNLTRKQIDQSITDTWLKLERAVSQELDKVLAGESQLNASTTTAVTKFLELSKEIAKDYHSHDEAMAATIYKLTNGKPETFKLPTFDDDEGELETDDQVISRNPKTKRKK